MSNRWRLDALLALLHSFQQCSGILGRWEGNNERLGEVEKRLRMETISPPSSLDL